MPVCRSKSIIVYLVFLTLAGCVSQSNPPAPAPGPSPISTVMLSPLPSPGAFASPLPSPGAFTSPLTTPERQIPTHATEAVSSPDKGTVSGVLTTEDTGLPMSDVNLFLGQHIGSTADAPIFGFDPKSAPHVVTDATGRFRFTNVPPGQYALIVWDPFRSFMAHDPQTKGYLALTVRAGGAIDLGTLVEKHP